MMKRSSMRSSIQDLWLLVLCLVVVWATILPEHQQQGAVRAEEEYDNDNDNDNDDEMEMEMEMEEPDDDDEAEVELSPHLLARGADLGVVQRPPSLHDNNNDDYDYDYDTTIVSSWTEQDFLWILTKARNYMEQVVPRKFGNGMKDLCRNEDEHCAYWALLGECDSNPEYMRLQCAPVCGSCYNLTVESRCPLDSNYEQSNAWQAGDLNAMFERLTSEPYRSQYEVQVLSSPSPKNNKTADGPCWVITMENVVTEEEAIQMIELGHIMGYKRSTDVGKRQAYGTYGKQVSEGRTSTNAWCQDICEEDPIAMRVNERLSTLTGIPEPNSERLQLLRYQEGQFYKSHHDMIESQVALRAGPRIVTVYIYLNDVHGGGGTHFEKLDLTVMPKRGRVVIWPSVYDHDVNEKDWRTMHEALPVEAGIKYGANAWFHLRDFKTPSDEGCM